MLDRALPGAMALAAALFFAIDPQQTGQVVETMTEQVGTFLLILSIWLLAGPGKNWHKATRSAKWASSSQRRFSTYSCRK